MQAEAEGWTPPGGNLGADPQKPGALNVLNTCITRLRKQLQWETPAGSVMRGLSCVVLLGSALGGYFFDHIRQ